MPNANRLDPLSAVVALEAHRAAEAKLAELRKSGLDRREWAKLSPDVQRGLLDANVPLTAPPPAQRRAELVAEGKRPWSSSEISMLHVEGRVPGALAGEIWGKGCVEALDREFKAARAEGRVIDDPEYISPLTPPEAAKSAARRKAADVLRAAGLGAHADRLAAELPRPQTIAALAVVLAAKELIAEIRGIECWSDDCPELAHRVRMLETEIRLAEEDLTDNPVNDRAISDHFREGRLDNEI